MNAINRPHIHYHHDIEQGSDTWLAIRCGILSASQMKLIVTPTLISASNDKERSHMYELLSQRITHYVEPQFVSDDMVRGMTDEAEARILYAEHYAPVQEVGFITNCRWGFTLGYSPDGLVGDDGLIEVKSRRQRFQVETLIHNVGDDGSTTIPADYMIQVQTGLLVSERKWLDFVSYSGGLPMVTIRVHPIETVQKAILDAASGFEERLSEKLLRYRNALQSDARLIPTERRIEQEMHL